MQTVSEIPVYQLAHTINPAVCHEYTRAANQAGRNPTNIHDLNPLFSRTLRHLSKPITQGAKYIIRSEVLYRPMSSQA